MVKRGVYVIDLSLAAVGLVMEEMSEFRAICAISETSQLRINDLLVYLCQFVGRALV